jgi:hypothetical protein
VTVVNLQPPISHKRKHRAVKPQLLTRERLGRRSNTAKLFAQMASAIEVDLGGRSQLSRIELELVEAFCGAALLMRHLNARLVLLKDGEPIDAAAFATATTALTRIAGQLGLSRRQRDVTAPSLNQYLRERKDGTG